MTLRDFYQVDVALQALVARARYERAVLREQGLAHKGISRAVRMRLERLGEWRALWAHGCFEGAGRGPESAPRE